MTAATNRSSGGSYSFARITAKVSIFLMHVSPGRAKLAACM